jgi:glucokinase
MTTAIGVDLGGTELRAALVDGQGQVLDHAQTRTDAAGGPDAVIAQILALVALIRGRTGVLPAGVGVGSPGPLDARAGVVIAPPSLTGWDRVPLRAILADRLGLPVALDNDGHAAALGEWRFGAAIGLSDFVYVTVSTGIGGGIVCDGRLLRGRGGLAGHIGHMIVTEDPVACACGNRGCWEALASGPALGRAARIAAQRRPDSVLAATGTVDARRVGEAARCGDALALDLIEREARWLGLGITSLLHLFSPERVLVGGGLSAVFDLMAPTLTATVARRAMPVFRAVPILPAALGPRTGVIGAATLILAPEGA